MRKQLIALTCAAVALSAAVWLVAQERKRASPHEQTSAVIAGKKITIEYGRPYKKDRQIFGGLVPYGKVWRTGADEATKLTTEADLMLGIIHVPKGTYSMFTVPDAKQWTLVLNKVPDQPGAYEYDQSKDLGRTPMKVQTVSAPVEQFTITIEPGSGNRGTLKMAWDTTVATASMMVH
jgi:Protein of unknown function (DUF2911)